MSAHTIKVILTIASVVLSLLTVFVEYKMNALDSSKPEDNPKKSDIIFRNPILLYLSCGILSLMTMFVENKQNDLEHSILKAELKDELLRELAK